MMNTKEKLLKKNSEEKRAEHIQSSQKAGNMVSDGLPCFPLLHVYRAHASCFLENPSYNVENCLAVDEKMADSMKQKAAVVTGSMTERMIWHVDHGWTYTSEKRGTYDQNTVCMLGQHLPLAHGRICDEGSGGKGGTLG